MSDKYSLKKWQELPPGGVIVDAGNAADYETGTWRTSRPQWISEHCIHCLNCWVFCPEEAYTLTDGKTASGKDRKEISGINLFHCKGCGICATECPVNKKGQNEAIKIVHEEN